MHIRRVATILILFVLGLVVVNRFLRSEWIWLMSIAITMIAVIIYFIPRLKK